MVSSTRNVGHGLLFDCSQCGHRCGQKVGEFPHFGSWRGGPGLVIVMAITIVVMPIPSRELAQRTPGFADLQHDLSGHRFRADDQRGCLLRLWCHNHLNHKALSSTGEIVLQTRGIPDGVRGVVHEADEALAVLVGAIASDVLN